MLEAAAAGAAERLCQQEAVSAYGSHSRGLWWRRWDPLRRGKAAGWSGFKKARVRNGRMAGMLRGRSEPVGRQGSV